jgi:hypothetical protein
VRVWLDDMRAAPVGFTWAKTARQAIDMLENCDVEFISLDHDLAEEHYADMDRSTGFSEDTGYAVVLWMEKNDAWPDLGCAVHSFNPVGKARMLAAIEQAYKRFSHVRCSTGIAATVMFDEMNEAVEQYING